jgi:hypothetical protein
MLFWALIWGGKIAPKKEEKNRKMHSAMNGRELLADMESKQPSDLEIHCGFKNAKNDVRLPPHTCQVAARMTTVFTTYRAYDTERQTMMKAQLQRIVDHQKEGLSENVFEIASKALA